MTEIDLRKLLGATLITVYCAITTGINVKYGMNFWSGIMIGITTITYLLLTRNMEYKR